MTATEELRALLDERGVEHYDGWSGEIRYTKWQGIHGMWFLTHDSFGTNGELLYVQGINMTPEEAVAATLGPGTCRMESMHGYTDPYVSTRYTVELSCHMLEDWPDSEPPSYCPWCGRKVER